jgi:hypothetical protein
VVTMGHPRNVGREGLRDVVGELNKFRKGDERK